MEAKTPRIIRCPGCGGPSVYASANEFRPFCSARCKNNDFGAWASERYAVDADTPPKDRLEEDAGPSDSAPTTH